MDFAAFANGQCRLHDAGLVIVGNVSLCQLNLLEHDGIFAVLHAFGNVERHADDFSVASCVAALGDDAAEEHDGAVGLLSEAEQGFCIGRHTFLVHRSHELVLTHLHEFCALGKRETELEGMDGS